MGTVIDISEPLERELDYNRVRHNRPPSCLEADTVKLGRGVVLHRMEPARLSDRDGLTIPPHSVAINDTVAAKRLRLFIKSCFINGSIEV